MMIITGDVTTEYGITPMGQFFEKKKVGNNTGIVRVTVSPERFLRWLIQSEVDIETENIMREKMIKLIRTWWENNEDGTMGSFNRELYLRIIEAKRKNGTI